MMDGMKTYDAIPQIEWARLAAYIDGEGCFLIFRCHNKKRPRGYHALKIVIGNTDFRLMVWLKSSFGGFINRSTKTEKHKLSKRQMYYWHVGSAMAEDVTRRCLPYLIMKKEQGELVLQFRATFKDYHDTTRLIGNIESDRENFKNQLHELKRKSVAEEDISETVQ
jgi:hypothetical protein